ncbi:hypothetical protein SADUNF_Sadunf06G0172000 [Salix dunnii]|uniref:Uncharacterized protein n=1 Tax=Salix dunnii TaxID=1413687 RepID=A0A835K5A0_9ROSI|nr:hypothetical protein SADUNF_Sadunf06G0172000 [Salix dunnii]
MENKLVNSATRSLATQLLFLISSILYTCTLATSQELLIGFKASPSSSVSPFQSLLNDSTSTFSLGFLRANQTQLALTVRSRPSDQSYFDTDLPHETKDGVFRDPCDNGRIILPTMMWVEAIVLGRISKSSLDFGRKLMQLSFTVHTTAEDSSGTFKWQNS